MRLTRPAAGALVGIGLVVGTLTESTPTPAPRQAEGYWILAGDLHVHGFMGDGAFAPWVLRREVARAGLDVFAFTNHNRTFPARFGRWLAEHDGEPIVLVGEEITASSFHLIAVGITEAVSPELGAADAIDAVHAQGGIAIAAHPESPTYTAGYDDRALARLDGFERAHPVIETHPERLSRFLEFQARAQRVNPGLALIGSSDFHVTGAPGRCRTYILARERSAAGVLDAIREGRTVAADAAGTLYGDPRFVQTVEAAGGHVPPPATEGLGSRVSVWSVWLGLLGLLVFRRRPS